jgi:hypothetical protein
MTTLNKPVAAGRALHYGRAAALFAAALLLASCAHTPPPTDQMAVSNAALASAVSAGAPELAPVEMNMAREKMTRANAAMAARDNELARTLAQEAQLDAQLAESRAGAVTARKAADAMQESGRALREEMGRKASPTTNP